MQIWSTELEVPECPFETPIAADISLISVFLLHACIFFSANKKREETPSISPECVRVAALRGVPE